VRQRRATRLRPNVWPAEETLGDVLNELELLFTDLDGLADKMIDLARQAGTAGDPLAREDLATLRPVIFNILSSRKGLVAGSGIIVAPDLLHDAPRWLEWWWTTPAGTPEALRINLDPTAPDFFDYTTADWYATPARTLVRRVSGPYVDYVCTNTYTITLATPVCHNGQLLGISAADVLISSLEQRVLPVLTAMPHPVVLANGDHRVIASNSPLWAPGMSIPFDQPSTSPKSPRGNGGSSVRSWVLVDVESPDGLIHP
jgi:hypothetical protein